MTVLELFQAGKLTEAIQALGEEVRNNPLDIRRRTFLFELLCFAGEYDRAEKHLNILADTSQQAQLGTLLYLSAIHAEKTRQRMFEEGTYPAAKSTSASSGMRRDLEFDNIVDADQRIGASLEIFVAGSYCWIAMEQIESIEVPTPRKLRDLLWTPALVVPKPEYRSMELGEVLLPVLSPLTWKHEDDSVRLGRCTVWEGDTPFGQKIFQIGSEEIPILELGKIEFSVAGEPRAASA